MQPPILARKRVFDYLEKCGLEKVTDVNAGDWHIYILKELIDNGLDADEAANLEPDVEVGFVYDLRGILSVSVVNRAAFPLSEIGKVFSLDCYASVKDFFNGITRGQQGNGLKTVLGIPYALRHFSHGDFALHVIPLSIDVGGERQDLWYELDEHSQAATLRTRTRPSPQPVSGTRMTVRVEGFLPKPAPSVKEIEELAYKYALFNPFARSAWQISIGDDGDRSLLEFNARQGHRLDHTPPPVHWYRFDQFTSLCHRLTKEGVAEVSQLLNCFQHLDEPRRQQQIKVELARAGISETEHLNSSDRRLAAYEILLRHTPQMAPEQLGELGGNAITLASKEYLNAEGRVCYGSRRESPPQERHAPYVLEVFMLRTPKVQQRTLWAGVNFTCLYKDPFYRKRFNADFDGQQTEVRGLDRILDRHGIEQQDNVLVGVHVISPNIEFQSYGKAEFDCQLIETSLLELVREVAGQFNRWNRIKQHEQCLLDGIAEATQDVSSAWCYRFTVPQLYRRVYQIVRRKSNRLPAPSTQHLERFQRVLLREYQEKHGPIKGLIGSHKAKFVTPSKPFATVLWVMKEGFEDVFLNNGIMNDLELALFWGEVDDDNPWSSLRSQLEPNKAYAILALHDADPRACARVAAIAHSFSQGGLSDCQLLDLGMSPALAEELGMPTDTSDEVPADVARALQANVGHTLTQDDYDAYVIDRRRYDLNDLSVQELIDWFHRRYLEIGIIKNRWLDENEIHIELARYVLQLARSHIEKRVSDELEIETTIGRLVESLADDLLVYFQTLLNKLRSSPPATWKELLDCHVADFVNNRLSCADVRIQFHTLEP